MYGFVTGGVSGMGGLMSWVRKSEVNFVFGFDEDEIFGKSV
jgi:hypothetical protein